jgi:hypothetical protein
MKTTAPIPFAGSELGEERRVCAFFNSADEQYRVLLRFIRAASGLSQTTAVAQHFHFPFLVDERYWRAAELDSRTGRQGI